MAWYHIPGNRQDTVVSAQVRLARNLTEYPFPGRLDAGRAREVIAKVEGAGLVERRRCEDDRRNFEIRLTEEGVKQAEAFERERQDMAQLLFATLTDGEKQQLMSLMSKLHEHWETCTYERRNANE